MRILSLFLIVALLVLSAPTAHAKPITPLQVHERIAKRGVGNWVGVELLNRTAFTGRIVSFDNDSFGLQLHNDPSVTPIRYADVVRMNTGISSGAFWTVMAAGIGGVAAMAAVGLHEVHAHDQLPALPAQPLTTSH
jgi:hypothetical protein